MDVNLIDYTGKGMDDPLYAARLLAYTKNTRLNMNPAGLKEFMLKPESEILEEIAYMATTIASSWEFANVTFSIVGITRACAQQVTRTRTASYAMQSQRVTDMTQATWHTPPGIKSDKQREMYNIYMRQSLARYEAFVSSGEALEDARGLLPINVHCNLIASYNLRSFADMVRTRTSLRVQDEYQELAIRMKQAVLDVWPWADVFFQPKEGVAIRLIERVAAHAKKWSDQPLPPNAIGDLARAADLLKK